MPLIKSDSKEAISKNIAIERAHGKPEKQAVAIAEQTARDAKKSHNSSPKSQEATLADSLCNIIKTKYGKR